MKQRFLIFLLILLVSVLLSSCFSSLETLLGKKEYLIYERIDDGWIVSFNYEQYRPDVVGSKLTIPSAYSGIPVVEIASEGFKNLYSITDLVVPSSVKRIGRNAFFGCGSLANIELPFVGASRYPSNEKEGYLGYIFGEWFHDSFVGSVRVHFNGGDAGVCNIPESLQKVVITDAVSIPAHAFCNCSMLKSIQINKDIKTINAYSFNNCSSITEIDLPNITSIPRNAFYGCSSLETFEIGEKVESIGSYAFGACTGFKSFVVPANVTSIGWNAFWGCSYLESITLPFIGSSKNPDSDKDGFFGCIFGANFSDSFTNSVRIAFQGGDYGHCNLPKDLKSVTITNAIRVPKNAFTNCKFIKELNINKAAKNKIGSSAFTNCVAPQYF